MDSKAKIFHKILNFISDLQSNTTLFFILFSKIWEFTIALSFKTADVEIDMATNQHFHLNATCAVLSQTELSEFGVFYLTCLQRF